MNNLYLLGFLLAAVAACSAPVPPTPQLPPAKPPAAPPSPAPVPPVPPAAPTIDARLADLAATIGKPATFANVTEAPDGVLCGEVSIAGAAPRRFYSTGVGIVYYTGPHVANLFRSVCGE